MPFFFKNGGELLQAFRHPANFRICALREGVLGLRHRTRPEYQKFLGEVGQLPGPDYHLPSIVGICLAFSKSFPLKPVDAGRHGAGRQARDFRQTARSCWPHIMEVTRGDEIGRMDALRCRDGIHPRNRELDDLLPGLQVRGD